jgi:hypothetical protein
MEVDVIPCSSRLNVEGNEYSEGSQIGSTILVATSPPARKMDSVPLSDGKCDEKVKYDDFWEEREVMPRNFEYSRKVRKMERQTRQPTVATDHSAQTLILQPRKSPGIEDTFYCKPESNRE